MKPKFFFCSEDMRKVWNDYGVFFSSKFCCFFSDKVEEIIKRDTGIVPSTKIGLSLFRPTHDLPMYEKGVLSVIRTAISILPEFIDNIDFYWQSKSGKIITTTEEDFDEQDLECWIKGLKPALYWKQVSSISENHPFQKDLPFELTVRNYGVLTKINIEVSDENISTEIIDNLQHLIETHNKKSEAQDRKYGVIHNYNFQRLDKLISLQIDLGSAGVTFIRKILKALAQSKRIVHIELDI